MKGGEKEPSPFLRREKKKGEKEKGEEEEASEKGYQHL